jgi:hypothetical protein
MGLQGAVSYLSPVECGENQPEMRSQGPVELSTISDGCTSQINNNPCQRLLVTYVDVVF